MYVLKYFEMSLKNLIYYIYIILQLYCILYSMLQIYLIFDQSISIIWIWYEFFLFFFFIVNMKIYFSGVFVCQRVLYFENFGNLLI